MSHIFVAGLAGAKFAETGPEARNHVAAAVRPGKISGTVQARRAVSQHACLAYAAPRLYISE